MWEGSDGYAPAPPVWFVFPIILQVWGLIFPVFNSCVWLSSCSRLDLFRSQEIVSWPVTLEVTCLHQERDAASLLPKISFLTLACLVASIVCAAGGGLMHNSCPTWWTQSLIKSPAVTTISDCCFLVQKLTKWEKVNASSRRLFWVCVTKAPSILSSSPSKRL